MSVPEPGAPHQLDSATRIVAVDDRHGRVYQVELRFGWDTWMPHSTARASFVDALEVAGQVLRRERGTRREDPPPGETDFQKDSQSWLRPDQRSDEPLPGPGLAGRIRIARRRIGWRPSI